MSKPVCIVWMNEARVYEQALARAGLGDRLEFNGVRVDQSIPAELAARGEILVGWSPAPGLLAEDPFWTTPGITVLPHIGGLHPARDEGVAEVFVANARRFLAGEPLTTLVDRARGY